MQDLLGNRNGCLARPVAGKQGAKKREQDSIDVGQEVRMHGHSVARGDAEFIGAFAAAALCLTRTRMSCRRRRHCCREHRVASPRIVAVVDPAVLNKTSTAG